MIGKTVSHYRITAKLGEGGMGAVYRADDLKLERPVALKFLPPDTAADAQARDRLLQEARAASRLNHPNIATVYEVSEAEDTPFIVMELVSGESLSHVLLRGALPATQFPGVARSIAEGLREAHTAGVLHRDMKPGNIMIDERSCPKILDFGLAQLTGHERAPGESADSFSTRTGSKWSTGGTVPYMAPEQLRGEQPDVRTDIFSFGTLLYECATGRLPFPGDTTVDVMHAILHAQPTALRDLVPDILPEWERFIERCMHKRPEQRFESMDETLAALPPDPIRKARSDKSVAVLYFENLTDAKDDAYFRDGITEDIITELSKIKGLRVFPRSSVLGYRDNPATAPQIGQELDALYVLEGSLRRAGNRIRVTANLVEARTGHSTWAERYDRQLEDVFAIQDEIAQNIAQTLRVMLTEQEKKAIAKAPTTDVQAYDFYLRGRQFFYQFKRQGLEFAGRMFRRAIEIDPGYARAYAGMADCYSVIYSYWDPSDANRERAEEASRQALELDPELAEAHCARGMALSINKQYEEARRAFRTAIRLNSQLFEAFYFFGRLCRSQGNLAESAQLFAEACRLRPEDYQAPSHLGACYTGLGKQADALEAYRRCVEVAENHLELHPDDGRALNLGAIALCALGQTERGLEWAERAAIMDPDEPTTLYNVACVYSKQGQIDRAIEYLERSIACGMHEKDWIRNDPDLEPLRADPRYRVLLEKI